MLERPVSHRSAWSSLVMPTTSVTPAETRQLDRHDVRTPDSVRALPSSVLHIIAPSPVGGAESVVRSLAAAQQDCGARVTVAAIVSPGERVPLVDDLRESCIDTREVVVAARGYLKERRALAAICGSAAPSVVHSHGYRPDIVDAVYLRRSGVPIVTTAHGFTGGGVRNRFYEWLQRRAYAQFDAVAAVSQPLYDRLGPVVASHRLHLVPNAYHGGTLLSRDAARASLGIPGNVFVVGWVGRLSREKGTDVLLDSLADVNVPESVHAAIIGDGPELTALRRQSIRLQLEHRLYWHARVRDARRFFTAFDAFVLSSRTEGTPMVLFEAMAAGVPIVATRVGGVPDVLPPGTASLVMAESPSQLAVAIRTTFVERAAAAAHARAARVRLATEYGVGAWAARYQAIYRQAREFTER